MSARVTIEPEEFKLVEFDRAELTALIESLLDAVGVDRPVTLEIDQTTPLGHAEVRSIGDRIGLFVESGALEDPRRIRKLSVSGAATVLGRLLFRVRDRLDPAFGEPPADDDISLDVSAAWDVYCAGRLVRLGYTHFEDRQRRLYQFRTRHDFSDTSDASFEVLWNGDGLTWADVERLSREARAASSV